MIPAYEPGPLFEQALRAVLEQDEGPDRMQIAVIDDASPTVDVESVVRRIAGNRVEYHRNAVNRGLSANFNSCIERARGRWVHLFHQDDLIWPGFYTRLAEADGSPAVAALCQYVEIDGAGRWTNLSGLHRTSPGLLDGWLRKVSVDQLIQFAAIVIRRDTYERLGGFRPDLCFALDWEMWVRIAMDGPVWFEPTALACYRKHGGSETSRLTAQRRNVDDVHRAIGVVQGYLPADLAPRAGSGVAAYFRREILRDAGRSLEAGDWRTGLTRIREACAHRPGLAWSRELTPYHRWLLKAFLRSTLRRRRIADVGATPR
jgi:GT2 family glycosyltransferase